MKKSQASRRFRKKRRTTFRGVAGIVCVLILAVACVTLGMRIRTEHERINTQQMLKSLYASNSSAQAESLNTQTPSSQPLSAGTVPENGTAQDPVPEVPPTTPDAAPKNPAAAQALPDSSEARGSSHVLQADFTELYAVNEDLVGWMDVGKDISLPIVHYDNTFYLNHDFYGKPDDAGTVFINEANSIWPADQNLLFHGHNMRDGSCFGNLDDFRKLDYLKQYPLVYFRTIYDVEATAYIPVALFDASMEASNRDYFDIGQIRFDSVEELTAFAQSAMNRSMYTLPFDVQEGDRLITLITCSYSNQNGRFIMLCRALRDGETEDSVRTFMQSATTK